MDKMEPLDLVHSYLTEQRFCGIMRIPGDKNFSNKSNRSKPYLRFCHIKDPGIELGSISQLNETSITISSKFLLRYTVGNESTTIVKLTNPTSLGQITDLLNKIIDSYNTFYKDVELYGCSIMIDQKTKLPRKIGGLLDKCDTKT